MKPMHKKTMYKKIGNGLNIELFGYIDPGLTHWLEKTFQMRRSWIEQYRIRNNIENELYK